MATIIHPPDQGLEQTQERAAQRAALTKNYPHYGVGAPDTGRAVLTAWLFRLTSFTWAAWRSAWPSPPAGPAHTHLPPRGQSRNGL
jgi:hypothetical protein